MNTPNKLTVLRLLLVIPFIVVLGITVSMAGNIDFDKFQTKSIYFMIAGGIFALAMITDFLDGYLARKNNQVTSFGKLFDPLADKFMTTSALVMLSVLGVVPFYITLMFILRDLVVDGSRNLAAQNKANVAASWYGKWKTMILSLGIVLVFAVLPFIGGTEDLIAPSWEIFVLIIPIMIANVLSIIGGVDYFWKIRQYINVK